MTRELLPTRKIAPGRVRAGDVVRVKSRAGVRWMLVDYAVGYGRPHVWSGRWAFDGQWMIYTHHTNTVVTVKHRDDARADAERLRASA